MYLIVCLFVSISPSFSESNPAGIVPIGEMYLSRCKGKKDDRQLVLCEQYQESIFGDLRKKVSPDLMLQISWVYEAIKYRLKEIDMTFANQSVLLGLVYQKPNGTIPAANSPMQRQMLERYHGMANAIVQLAWTKREEENSNKQEANLKNRFISCPVVNGDDCRQSINELIAIERERREGLVLMRNMLLDAYPPLSQSKLKTCVDQAYNDGLDKQLQSSDDPEVGLFNSDASFATKVCYGKFNERLSDTLTDSQEKLRGKKTYYTELIQNPNLLTYLTNPITSAAKEDLLELTTAFENKKIGAIDEILEYSKCAVTQKANAYEDMRTRNEIALGVASMIGTLGLGTMASVAGAGARIASGAANAGKLARMLDIAEGAMDALMIGEGLVQFHQARTRCENMEAEALVGGPEGRIHFEECRSEMNARGLFALLPLVRPALRAAKGAKALVAGKTVNAAAPKAAAAPASAAPVKLAPLELPPPRVATTKPIPAPVDLPPPTTVAQTANVADDLPLVTGTLIHRDVDEFAKLFPNDARKFLTRFAAEFDAMSPTHKAYMKEVLEMINPPSARGKYLQQLMDTPRALRGQHLTKVLADKVYDDLVAMGNIEKMIAKGDSADVVLNFARSKMTPRAFSRFEASLKKDGLAGVMKLQDEFTNKSLQRMKIHLDEMGVKSEIVGRVGEDAAYLRILPEGPSTRSYLTRYVKALKSARDEEVVWEPWSQASGKKHGLFEAEKKRIVIPKETLDDGAEKISSDTILSHEGIHSQTSRLINEKQNRPYFGYMVGDLPKGGHSAYAQSQHFDELRTFAYESKQHLKKASNLLDAPGKGPKNLNLERETFIVIDRAVSAKALSERTIETLDLLRTSKGKTVSFFKLDKTLHPDLQDGVEIVAASVQVVENGKAVSMVIPLVKSSGLQDQAANMALLSKQMDDLNSFANSTIKSADDMIAEGNALRVRGGLQQIDEHLHLQAVEAM